MRSNRYNVNIFFHAQAVYERGMKKFEKIPNKDEYNV